MGDFVRPKKYADCDAVGILKANININDAYEKLLKKIASEETIDKNFLALAKERRNVDGKVKYHEVFGIVFNFNYYTKNYDFYDTEEVNKKLTEDLHIVDVHTTVHHTDTITTQHKDNGKGLVFKDPFTHEVVYVPFAGDCFDIIKKRLGWESRMFTPSSVFELDVASNNIELIADCEYLNVAKDRFKIDRYTLNTFADDLARKRNKILEIHATTTLAKNFFAACYLQPYYVFEFSFNGRNYTYYVNGFTKEIVNYGLPPTDEDVKNNLKANRRLEQYIKLPLLVCGAFNIIGWLTYVIKIASSPSPDIGGIVAMVICFAVIPNVFLGLFYFLWIDYHYSHNKETFKSLIKNNKKEFIKTIIAYIIALIAFILAIVAFSII